MQRLKLCVLVGCALLCTAATALASGDASHGLPWENFIFRVINFVAFVGLLAYFFGKKAVAFFKGRTEGIASEISSLEQRKVEAQASLAQVEKRIADLDAERAAILAEYEAQGEALKASIVSGAEKAAAQIAEQAKTTAQNEINAAIEAMRAEMAEKIVAAAEKMLSEKLSASGHSALVDKYLTKVVLN